MKQLSTGYSGTPLAKKLGIREGSRVIVRGAPSDYRRLLAPLPPDVEFVTRATTTVDLVHLFATDTAELRTALVDLRKKLRPDATLWVSWPKKGSGVASDISEQTIRDLALPLGWVDVKVCAVNEVWSGLKLVVRKELRG